MKKTLLAITLTAFFAVTTACGQIQSRAVDYNGENDEEIFKYQQYTPSDKIVKGSKTAIDTLEDYLNIEGIKEKDSLGPFDMICDPVYGSTKNDDEYFLYYDVNVFPSDTTVFFLYKDDTAIAEAIPRESCLSGTKVDVTNFTNGVYAWAERKEAGIVLGQEALYRLTSIWCWNKETNEATRLYEYTDCPIWAQD